MNPNNFGSTSTSATFDLPEIFRHDLVGNRNNSGEHDAKGGITIYTYDAAGRLIDVEDALHHHTRFSFYTDGLTESVENAEGQKKFFFYSAARDLSLIRNARGQEIKLHHDLAHQLRKKFLPGGEVVGGASTRLVGNSTLSAYWRLAAF